MHSKLIDAWHSGWEISDQCPGNKFYTNKFCHAPHSRSIWKQIAHIQRQLVSSRNKIKSQSRVMLLLCMKNLHFCFVLNHEPLNKSQKLPPISSANTINCSSYASTLTWWTPLSSCYDTWQLRCWPILLSCFLCFEVEKLPDWGKILHHHLSFLHSLKINHLDHNVRHCCKKMLCCERLTNTLFGVVRFWSERRQSVG